MREKFIVEGIGAPEANILPKINFDNWNEAINYPGIVGVVKSTREQKWYLDLRSCDGRWFYCSRLSESDRLWRIPVPQEVVEYFGFENNELNSQHLLNLKGD